MPHTVLIVTGSGDIALSELLIRALDEPDITVIPKTNAESALNYIKAAPPDFIVASFTLAADKNSPVEPGGGILFCEAARAISAAPMALVTSAITNAVQQRVSRMASPPICVTVDADLPAMLLVQIRAVRAELLRLDITIRADPGGEWSYDLHGTGFEFERRGRLNVPASLLGALKTVALALSEAKERWREIFYGPARASSTASAPTTRCSASSFVPGSRLQAAWRTRALHSSSLTRCTKSRSKRSAARWRSCPSRG